MARHIPKILSAAVVVALIILIAKNHNTVDDDGNQPLMLIFILYVVLAFVLGFNFIAYILPWMGDRLGDLVYSGEGELAEDPKAPVRALEASGDYEGAIAMLREILVKHPNDRTIVTEIAKLYQDNLDSPEAAISTLEQALADPNAPWDVDDRAFFMFRLADMFWQERGAFDEARRMLEKVQAEFPETRHSANANHKMREVDEAEFAASKASH